MPSLHPDAPADDPLITCWILTADDDFLASAAEGLAEVSVIVRALHPDDLESAALSSGDVLLLDWRAVSSPEKALAELCASARIPEPAGVALLARGEELAAGSALVEAWNEEPDWGRIADRLRRLARLRERLVALGTERFLSSWMREVAGVSLWRVDLARQVVEFLDENPVGLPAGSRWSRETWHELEAMVPGEDRARIRAQAEQLREPGARVQLRHRMLGPNGKLRVLDHCIARAPGGIPWVVGAVRDVTADASEVRRLEDLRHYDALTGFMVRQVFLGCLARVFADESAREQPISLLQIDLDGFKRLNDRHGHWFGDQILRQVSERLRSTTRYSPRVPMAPSEWYLPRFGRVGADEFDLLLPGVSRADAQVLGEELVARLSEPYEVGEQRANVTASIGLATAPEDAADPVGLLRNADIATHQAKRAGGDTTRAYSPSTGAAVRRKTSIESGLRSALEEGELELYYQPRYRTRSGRITGAEALLRWNSPVLGQVSPADFIPVAEDVGLIVPLGDWVMNELCRYVARWERADQPLRFSFNVSGAQLLFEDLHANLLASLAATGVTAENLELEITESVAIQYVSGAVETLRSLRETGVHIALDDFGTGYSSLSVLIDLPLDSLKLDRSIVSGLGNNPDVASVAGAMIGMAHSLGLSVVAEGVETEAQLRVLRGLDCDEVQGFYYAPPLPAADFERLVRENLE